MQHIASRDVIQWLSCIMGNVGKGIFKGWKMRGVKKKKKLAYWFERQSLGPALHFYSTVGQFEDYVTFLIPRMVLHFQNMVPTLPTMQHNH